MPRDNDNCPLYISRLVKFLVLLQDCDIMTHRLCGTAFQYGFTIGIRLGVRQTLVEIDFPGTFIHREEVGVTLNYSKACVDIDI